MTNPDYIQTIDKEMSIKKIMSKYSNISGISPKTIQKIYFEESKDISEIEEGQSITVKWRGKPVFIRKRTKIEIEEAKAVNISDLKHPEQDVDRVKKEEWLVLIGVCTHLGCVPLGQKLTDTKGEYNGWYCPCHGSHYDTSGRIRKGPAPDNLPIPPYSFLNETTIKIG